MQVVLLTEHYRTRAEKPSGQHTDRSFHLLGEMKRHIRKQTPPMSLNVSRVHKDTLLPQAGYSLDTQYQHRAKSTTTVHLEVRWREETSLLLPSTLVNAAWDLKKNHVVLKSIRRMESFSSLAGTDKLVMGLLVHHLGFIPGVAVRRLGILRGSPPI